jgi:hypothetical protein
MDLTEENLEGLKTVLSYLTMKVNESGYSAGAGGASRGGGRRRRATTPTCSLNRVFGTSKRNFSLLMAPEQDI